MHIRAFEHIHCIGIGGIGVSAIALILAQRGCRVSGCDLDLDQTTIPSLRNSKISIRQGHNTPSCQDPSIDLLVRSSDIPLEHPEVQRALHNGITVLTRAQALSRLMRDYCSIAVAGSHGKTTTTALITHMFQTAGYNPTFAIGGQLPSSGTNALQGTDPFFIAEADESDRSFLELHPHHAVLTNISREHLETYADLDDIIDTFTQFLCQLPSHGTAVVCIDNPYVQKVISRFSGNVITYGITNPNADIRADNIVLLSDRSTHTLHAHSYLEQPCTLSLSVPGKHTILNSLAAVGIAQLFKLPVQAVIDTFATFTSVDRRFTFRGTFFNGVEIFEDYGHHPTEIMYTLEVAKKRAQKNLIVLFQPHRFTRTHKLWNDFVTILASPHINHLIITDIFAKGENPVASITSANLVEAIKQHNKNVNVTYCPFDKTLASIRHEIESVAQPDDLLLILGAGKAYKLIDFAPHFP